MPVAALVRMASLVLHAGEAEIAFGPYAKERTSCENGPGGNRFVFLVGGRAKENQVGLVRLVGPESLCLLRHRVAGGFLPGGVDEFDDQPGEVAQGPEIVARRAGLLGNDRLV